MGGKSGICWGFSVFVLFPWSVEKLESQKGVVSVEADGRAGTLDVTLFPFIKTLPATPGCVKKRIPGIVPFHTFCLLLNSLRSPWVSKR